MSMTFGEVVLIERKRRGMSQTELAETVETSKAAIGRIERGEVLPDIDTAARIAKHLSISLDAVFNN